MIKTDGSLINGKNFDLLKEQTRASLALQTTNKVFEDNNIIDIYFNDVKREYIKHPMSDSDELEFLPENRDVFLKNNLKLVVNVAKRYTSVGVPFADLIQAGNYGLCIAFERYDTSRATLRNAVIAEADAYEDNEHIPFEFVDEIIKKHFVYAKNLEKTLEAIPKEGFNSKAEFVTWTKENIKTAIFASVAFQWIRATILDEISKNGKTIRTSKPSKNSDEPGIQFIYLDAENLRTNDCYHDNQISEVANENFIVEDDQINRVEREATYDEIVDNLLTVLNSTEKRIIQKRFGIGYPYQLSPLEIAENEGLSTNKIKYIIQIAMNKLTQSISPQQAKYIKDLLCDN